jgi:hypothetical protein
MLRRYLAKMTGLSRAQATRLIAQYQRGRHVQAKPYRRHRFAAPYTRAGIELLAQVDEAHETLNGPGHPQGAGAGVSRLRGPALPAVGGRVGYRYIAQDRAEAIAEFYRST